MVEANVEFIYGGQLVHYPKAFYKGGRRVVKTVSEETFSVRDLIEKWPRELQLKWIRRVWYHIPGQSLPHGLVMVKNPVTFGKIWDDVLTKNKVVQVFVEHDKVPKVMKNVPGSESVTFIDLGVNEVEKFLAGSEPSGRNDGGQCARNDSGPGDRNGNDVEVNVIDDVVLVDGDPGGIGGSLELGSEFVLVDGDGPLGSNGDGPLSDNRNEPLGDEDGPGLEVVRSVEVIFYGGSVNEADMGLMNEVDEGTACAGKRPDDEKKQNGSEPDSDSDSLDDDYASSDEGDYEFSDAEEDEWIKSMANEIAAEVNAESDSDKEWVPNEDDHDEDDADQSSGSSASDNDVGENRRSKKPRIVDPTQRMTTKKFEYTSEGKIVFERTQVFATVYHFREVLREYKVMEGYSLKRKKNGKDKVQAYCSTLGCKWSIFASLIPDGRTFMVKTVKGKHTYVRPPKNDKATSTWIANKLLPYFSSDPKTSDATIKTILKEQFGIKNINRMKLWRAKRKALEAVQGTHANSYKKLPKYVDQLITFNPGSHIFLGYDPAFNPGVVSPRQFLRIFICLKAMKEGFLKGCRPFIGLDGCHLKGPYGGVLLAAVSLDANNGLFPLAYAIVEGENKDSWEFFLHSLYECIKTALDKPLCFMSDRQKSLPEAVASIFPDDSHRHCARHIYANMKKEGYGSLEMKLAFWGAGKACTFLEFQRHMSEIFNIDENAKKYLDNIPAARWSRHMFDPQVLNDHVTNNVAESFNHWIGKFRELPILALLEKIRLKIMSRFNDRKLKAMDMETKTTPYVRNLLDKTIEKGRILRMFRVSLDEYQVFEGLNKYSVDLAGGYCSCHAWALSGIPCKHVTPCLGFRRLGLEDYCNWFYTKDAFLQTYNEVVHPLTEWDLDPKEGELLVLPPILKRSIGRPRKNRRKEVGEVLRSTVIMRSCTVRCNICKQHGHNSRSCQRDRADQLQGATNPKPKNKGGRPRNDGRPSGSVTVTTTVVEGYVSGRGGRGNRGGSGRRGGRFGISTKANSGIAAAGSSGVNSTVTAPIVNSGKSGRGGRGTGGRPSGRGGRGTRGRPSKKTTNTCVEGSQPSTQGSAIN